MLLLTVILGVPSALAQEIRPTQAQTRHVEQSGGLLGTLWSFVTHIWSAQGSASVFCLTGDAGCRIDPLGDAANQNIDAGCRMDPLGACLPDH